MSESASERTTDLMAAAVAAAYQAVVDLVRLGNEYADQHPEPDEDGFFFERQPENVASDDPRVNALARCFFRLALKRGCA